MMLKNKIAVLIGILAITGVASADLSKGLVALYSFDDCTSKDVSGNGNNGTVYGNPICVNGRVPNAAEPTAFNFNGTNDYVEIPHPGYLTEGTVAGWVYYSSIPNPLPGTGLYWFGLTVQGFSQGDGAQFGTHPSYSPNIAFGIYQFGGSGWNWADSGVKPVKGQWYHMVGTFGANGIKVYLNGQLKGTNSYTGGIPLKTHSAYLAIDAYQSFFNGTLDDVRIYNRALTNSEIVALYNQGSEVKGNIQGLKSGLNVICENLTTGKTVTVTTANFSCEAVGLVVKPNDHINIHMDGFAR